MRGLRRTVPRDWIRANVRLPGTVRDARGRVLIRAGATLTEGQVRLLESYDPDHLLAGADWPDDFELLQLQQENAFPGDALLDAGAAETAEAEIDALLAGAADGMDVADDVDSHEPDGESVDASSDAVEFAPRVEPAPAELVNVASLRPGMRLAHDIYDDLDVLLLAAGMTITPRFLQLLSQRRIKLVRLRPSGSPPPTSLAEPAAEEEEWDESRAEEVALPPDLREQLRMRSVKAWRRPRLPIETLRIEAAKGLERHAAVSVAVAELGETLQLGGKVSVVHVRANIKNFVNMVSLDFDLLPLVVAMQRTKDEYLFDHCVNVALLSVSIAAQLGIGHEELMNIGLAGFLHDIGMLRVPGGIRLAPRALTDEETREVRRHPFHTVAMMQGIRGLPSVVRHVAFQAHERADGSGYPKGRVGSLIHPYAMVVGIADTFSAMTRPRPYREAMTPYEAAKRILMDGSENRFDRTIVRAFLDSVALFPIGSIVELSDGRRATVVRANPDKHTRPIVEEISDDGRPTSRLIDLKKEEKIQVVRAHPTPESGPVMTIA